jgi:3-hydroxyisobutyrate dehydrogenase-like beta-hydroxyacid dehydrogenase
MSQSVGFIGLGIMGQPMCRNLMRAGYTVTVYNRTSAKAAAAATAGAMVAATPRAAAQDKDAVVLMLTGPDAIDNVLHGAEGVLAGIAAGRPLVNMSTVSPAYADALASLLRERGIQFIDAPVSGSKKPAEEGELVILASGERQQVTALEPLLLAMGKRIIYCGPAGAGTRMKLTVNILLGSMMEGFCEAVGFGQRAGLSLDVMLDAMLAGPLACGLFQLKREMLHRDHYPPQFPLRHMTKDLGFAAQSAGEMGAAVPATRMLLDLYRRGVEAGLGDQDFAAIRRVLQAMNAR